MLKKNSEIKWSDRAKKSFAAIKLALTKALVLASPFFPKHFLTFSFSSEETIVAILLQNNCEGHEQPIDFFSHALRDVELKYSLMEKKAYVLVKDLK